MKDGSGLNVPGVSVRISYPSNGTLINPGVLTTTDSNGLYKFQNIPQGMRVVQVDPHLSYKPESAFTSGGSGNDVQFTVQNLGQNATTFSSMTVTYNVDPPASYEEVKVNGASVFKAAASSGTTINFTRTVSGTGVIQQPFSVDVGNLYMQVPDVVIGSVGVGGTRMRARMT